MSVVRVWLTLNVHVHAYGGLPDSLIHFVADSAFSSHD